MPTAPPRATPAMHAPRGWRSALQGMRLSTRLLLVIATCLLPTLALQLGIAWRQWEDRRTQLGSLATQQAQLLAGNVEGIAQAGRILLGAASEYRQVRIRGENCALRLAELRQHAPGFAFLAVVDADGRIRCASDPRLKETAPDAPWLSAARAAGEFSAGRFAQSALHPGGFLPLHLPMPAETAADGETTAAGTLVAGLDLGWLAEHLQGLKRAGQPFLAGGVLTVADADGRILGRDIRHGEFVGQRFPAAALPLLEAREPGILRLLSLDGTYRLVGFTPPTPASHGLVAVVGFHEPELMGDIRHALLRGAGLLAVVVLLAAGLTLLVARRFITRPTRALLATARRWREGDLSARAPSCGPRSEFGQIAAAYNEMAAALQRREEEMRGQAQALEAAVAGRTRELTEANARLQAEIAEHRSTAAALAQAQKVQAVGQLAGGIAHDFNNVLQAVLGGVALIRRRAGDAAAVQRLAAMVEDSARRGESVTRRLLTFSRRQELRAEPLDLAPLLEGMREVLSATLGARIGVRVEVAPGLPRIMADRGQLETVLVNLATNARDAMPQGGTLTLSARLDRSGTVPEGSASGPHVELSVADTGEGMDVATLARAAEPFFTTKPLGQGTGLGLAMARSFAQGSGGQLRIESTPGAGTTVTLLLPAAEAEATPAQRRARPAARSAGEARIPILLVDDEPAVREVLATQLSEEGHDVTQAGGAAEALELLEAGLACEVLVTDLAMPGQDGVALIRAAQRLRPGLPAILVTGFAGDAATLAVGAAVCGPFMLLRKPVDGAELADRVAGLLATVREAAPAE